MDIYLLSGTHWDREWYQTFQGFRMRLVKLMDKLLDILENDKDFGVFHLDGQTIVLEDYLEIRPENKERIEALIKSGKLLVGPWYCMPDEFLLSGESLIKNLQKGFKIARSYGAEPLKYGYICDIFGHIAQMPQIFSEMGIHNALLGRGTNEHTTPMHFLWESPDGSRVTTFKLQDFGGYSAFCLHVLDDPDADDAVIKEKIKKYVDYEIERSNVPVLLLMDGNDHTPCHEDTPKYIEMIKELYPGANVHHESVMEMCEKLKEFENELTVKCGELREPAKVKDVPYLHLITNTLSSRYPLKKANDILQTRLEKLIQPLYALKMLNMPLTYLELCDKYLIQNHPHDSICGCSIDAVHTDMEYRFNQGMEISDELLGNWVGVCPVPGNEGAFTVQVYHPLPYFDKRVISLEIPFPKDYKTKYQEPFGYEEINSFTVEDENGNELPYGLLNIERNHFERYFEMNGRGSDKYTIRVEAELKPMGITRFVIKPKEYPSRYLSRLSYGERFADNGRIRMEFAADGTLSLYDYETDKRYSGLLAINDDGEIGDGWYHANPAIDRVVTQTAHELEIEHNSALGITFRLSQITKVPEEIDGKKRSEEKTELKVVHHITMAKDARRLEIKTEIDNTAKDHRMRLKLPTGIEGDKYFANQAFCFIERDCDFDIATRNYREAEPLEKQTAGIVGKKDKKGGLAFISEYGLHECGVTSGGDIFITLMRAFRTTVMTSGEPGGQLLQKLTYSYQLAPFGKEMNYAALQKQQDELQAGLVSFVSEEAKETAPFEVLGDNIVYSTAVPEKDGFAVRVYNDSDKKQKAEIRLPEGCKNAKLINFDGMEKGTPDIDGETLSFEMRPWEIATISVER